MKKIYLVFNICNCAEDYMSVSQFCDALSSPAGDTKLPADLEGKVYVYQTAEPYNAEKLFSVIAKELKRGTLKAYESGCLGQNAEICGCLRIMHETEDATIEYIYLDALLHKFPGLVCLLYAVGNQQEKYAVLKKAAEFFFGFSVKNKAYSNRIYGEFYSNKDQMWHITRVGLSRAETEHSKVNPVIELDDREQEVQFWRNSIRQHEENGEQENVRLQQVIRRCRMNFIEEFKRNARSRNRYYENLYGSEEFYHETKDMPLLAFYLFCMQMYYLKDGKQLDENEIKRIRLNAWDIADGILQLMENIHHTTEKVGFLDIRVHENVPKKGYLNKRYGIEDEKYRFYYEIRLLDISQENIVESFRRQMKNAAGTEVMRVSHFFELEQEDKVTEFWKNYNRKEENLVHHYGLQVFSSIVSANDGVFKVVSSSGYQYDRDEDTYANRDSWDRGDSGLAHLPGTEYIILMPLRGREQRIVTSVETDTEYQYDMTTDYTVEEYEPKQEGLPVSAIRYSSQEQKEQLIDALAEKMYGWMQKMADDLEDEKVPVTLIPVKKWVDYPLEIYCKALILCGIWWKSRQKSAFYCILNGCTENQILEIARLFAIFYCKVCLPRYLADMQIYLAGENEEFLITGGNLNTLYAITSKIMLVKGINRETTNIMEYLLGQYGMDRIPEEREREKLRLVPFDTLEFPGTNMTLFEKNVKRILNADIQRYSLGCKIKDTHMRIGSKLHIKYFFEAELLFHNNYYISRFADLILKRLPIDKEKKLILVGYETYSELLLYKIVTELRERAQKGEIPYQASYMIYEQRIGGKFRYMDEGCLESERQLQFAIIIPINSTLTTHNKVRNSLEEELEEKGLLGDTGLQIIANYALIQIRSSAEELDDLEQKFWQKIEGRTIKTYLIPEGEPDVEYFVCVDTKWYPPLKCPVCFPEDYAREKPLVETDRTSIVPVQMLGMLEPDLISRVKTEKNEENLERVKALKDSLVYKHVVRNGNHYLYYFCLERYFIQERSKIIAWLKKERKKRTEVTDRIVYDIIVSPLHYSDAGFLAEVNHYLFDNAALVLNFELEKEFRENVRTKYSNIIGLYYNLVQMRKKALIRFHFVDDTVVSGRTFSRAKTVFQSLICPVNEDIRVEVFSDIVLLLNRMSGDSVRNLIGNDINGSADENRMRHFHAFVNLNISSMRNHEDACTECKLVTNFTNLRNQSSTNQQYQFWNDKIEQHMPKEIQNKMQEEILTDSEERRKRAYRRMLCTHLANERLKELGYEKNDPEKVRKVMIELMTEPKEERIEWMISYVKVLSRPFVSYLKSNREAIFQIMLWMTEYITEELMTGQRTVGSRYKEIKDICRCIRELRGKSDDVICNLLLILMKRLSDLGSNYIIRKEKMIRILEVVNKLQISAEEKREFEDRYIGMMKRICCQSSDENKSMFLEYLLLCGEEYGKVEEGAKEAILCGEKLASFSESVGEEFVSRAFLENTRVLNDGILDLERDVSKSKKGRVQKKSLKSLMQEYYYENFRSLLYLYGYWEQQEEQPTEEGKGLLKAMVDLYKYLKAENEKSAEVDAEVYYKKLLEIIERLTGVEKCYLLYGTTMDRTGAKQYYRIQANGNVEYLKIADDSLGMKNMVADTYVPAFCVEEYETKLKRTIIKYDIYNEKEKKPVNTIFLQMDFPEKFTERRIFILLKMVMVFHNLILQHLRQDFSNNMIQKWSAREYFNKQVLLQRATDHTDRDNLLKYYNEISRLYKYKDTLDEEQRQRDNALFHMVINSYIARMNVQILAEANPEREPSRAAFFSVYDKQLKPLIESMHVIEKFRILNEKGEEAFSETLLDRRVRLRQTEEGECLSFRRISVIIAELILSAINHSGKREIADVYIYREHEYLVVKNQFRSRKGMERIKRDIQDSVERKKDGISLATIKGTVNACYDLTEKAGVIIDAELEDRKKYFYVKLPILRIWEE